MSNISLKSKAAAFHIMLLAFVGRRDGSTGYEIASRLKEPVTLLWPVNHSQIYPALKKLEQESLLSSEWLAQDGKPNKKKYSLTKDGRNAIKSWLVNLADESLTHEQILICSYTVGFADPGLITQKFENFVEQMKAEISALKARLAETGIPDTPDYPEQDLAFGVVALYRQAIMVREARVDWANWVLKGL